MGRLDSEKAIPSNTHDSGLEAVTNKQDPRRFEESAGVKSLDKTPPVQQVDHSMHDEEPLGWDQAPMGKARQEDKRQPRTKGNGGIRE
jgi:hypothetical protein